MRVEKIELIGFKSFCDRTAIHLHPGITCIVGPNGCGKSNVVDAFRWVLGEQSAKSLRGGKMEEVIFAGSQSKKPRGMAEVTLTVSGLGPSDNGKERLTTVTRRLYRSGDSEYQLNRQTCRLRDIRDIFLDTGLEVKSYSIMEQDRIAAILTAKPEERRFIIEEVAGVVKYRVRRNEALSKLESSRNNLQRINDITAEVRRQINSLDRQAKKAARYKKLMEELREIELRLAKDSLRKLDAALEDIMKALGGAREEDTLFRADLSRMEAEIESRRIALAEKEKALNGDKEALQHVEREMAEIERSLAVSRNERANLGEYTVKLRQQGEDNARRRAAAEERLREISKSKEELQSEADSLKDAISEREASLKAYQDEIAEAEGLLERKRQEGARASDNVSALKAELNRQHAALDALRGRAAEIDKGMQEESAYRQEYEHALKGAEEGILQRIDRERTLKEELDALVTEIEGRKNHIEELRARGAEARETLASLTSRLASLKEMASAELSGDTLSGVNVMANLSDVLEVPREYERAVECALGEKIKGFILNSPDEVLRAAAALKEKDAGRATFIPMGLAIRNEEGSLPEGALAWASGVASSTEGFSDAASALLRGIAVVSDLHSAMAIVKAGGARGVLVTLEGEMVEPSGAVTAGKSRGILTLKRQIRELTDEIEKKKEKIEGLKAQTEGLSGDLMEREGALGALQQKLLETERELSLMRVKAEQHTEDMGRADKRLSQLRLDRKEAEAETERITVVLKQKEEEVTGGDARRAALEAEMEGLKAALFEKRTSYEQKRAGHVEVQLSLNSCTERLKALSGEAGATEALLKELGEKDGFIGRELQETALRITKAEEEAASKELSLKDLAVKASQMNEKISAARDVMDGESAEVQDMERGLRASRLRIDEVAHSISDLDVKRAEHSLMIQNLKENIHNTYGIDLAAHECEPPTEEDPQAQQELKGKIESLGPVSLGSIEEYDELKERFDFLSAQQEDLKKSIAELEEAISRINSTTRKRLREAFEALNAKFSEVFLNLFGGGRAGLVLTDENNILETGVDIVAQPPGKKLQNITLLSGGEKTLTALALLFASFLIKPTPLCVLDEADAALDESNTDKFANLLRELAKEIQFIVVTHNRVTMEAADNIYGVTMEEPGNSKTISLQMAEA